MIVGPPVHNAVDPAKHRPDEEIRQVARELETSFLAEMLKHAGMGKSREGFGGGSGEDQFASFLLHAQAEKIVEKGGIGLAESLFKALKEKADD